LAKEIILVGLLLWSFMFSSLAQDTLSSVTLKQAEVLYNNPTISEGRVLDSDSLLDKGLWHLGQVLSLQSGVQVRSYGLSGASSPIFRSAGANHTQVYWNGVNINSATLGQADLRTLPLVNGQVISVKKGLESIADGSGGFGGSVSINQAFRSKPTTEFSLDFGSLNSLRSIAYTEYKLKKWQLSTQIQYEKAKNDFSYVNTFLNDSPLLDREGEELSNVSFTQTLRRALNEKYSLNFIFYTNDLNRGVVDPISSTQAKGNLRDGHYRFLTGIKKFGKVNQELILYSSVEKMEYDQNVFSEFLIKSAAVNYKAHLKFKPNFVADFSSENTINQVASSGFTDDIAVHRNSVKALFTYDAGKFRSLFLTRIEHFDGTISQPIYALTTSFKVTKNVGLIAMAGRTFRFPSLNDLYWNPGGNHELNPERGSSVEAGVTLDKPKFNIKLRAFHSQTKNLIIWQPGTDYWSPVNVNNAQVRGIELDSEVKLVSKPITSVTWVNSSAYNRAINTSETGEITASIYRPEWLINNRFYASFKSKSKLEFGHEFMSSRIYQTYRSRTLPAFHLLSAAVSRNLSLAKKIDLSVSLRANNILGTSYEIIKWYPMPLRNYNLILKISLK